MDDTRHLPDVDDPGLRGFWEGCRFGELRIPRCGACRRWVWYPRLRCPDCGGSDMPWTAVSGRGRLFTWVVVHRSFLPGLTGRVPYVTALVELEEDPRLRLATWLEARPDDRLRIGDAVAVFFETIDERVCLPRFRPTGPEAR